MTPKFKAGDVVTVLRQSEPCEALILRQVHPRVWRRPGEIYYLVSRRKKNGQWVADAGTWAESHLLSEMARAARTPVARWNVGRGRTGDMSARTIEEIREAFDACLNPDNLSDASRVVSEAIDELQSLRARFTRARYLLGRALDPILKSVPATYPAHPKSIEGQLVCPLCGEVAVHPAPFQRHGRDCPVFRIERAFSWLKPLEELEADATMRQRALRKMQAEETRRFERIRANVRALTENKKKARKRR